MYECAILIIVFFSLSMLTLELFDVSILPSVLTDTVPHSVFDTTLSLDLVSIQSFQSRSGKGELLVAFS